MATRGRLRDTLCRKLVAYLVDAKREFLCPQGANGQLAAPQYPLRKLEEAI